MPISFKVARDFPPLHHYEERTEKSVMHLGFPAGEHVNRMQFCFLARQQKKKSETLQEDTETKKTEEC